MREHLLDRAVLGILHGMAVLLQLSDGVSNLIRYIVCHIQGIREHTCQQLLSQRQNIQFSQCSGQALFLIQNRLQ